MKLLPFDWMYRGWLDEEYKRYLVMAYEKKVNDLLKQKKLFPEYKNLNQHVDLLETIVKNKNEVESKNKRIIGFDWDKKQFLMSNDYHENKKLNEMHEIINFSLPKFEKLLLDATALNDQIQTGLHLESFGIVPLYLKEGYIFVHIEKNNECSVFRYNAFHLEQLYKNVYTVGLKPIKNYKLSPGKTFYHIKRKLIKRYNELPNPATFILHSIENYPVDHALAPIAGQLLAKKLFWT